MDKKELQKYIGIGIIVVIICLIVRNLSFIGAAIGTVFSAAYPLLLGCAISYVFNIFLNFCEKFYFPNKKDGFAAYSRRPVCLVLTLALTITLIVVLLNVIIPELVTAVKLIYAEIPDALAALRDYVVKYLNDYPETQATIINGLNEMSTGINDYLGDIMNGAMGVLEKAAEVVGALTSSVVNIVLAIIFAIYLLLNKSKIYNDVRRLKNAFLNEKANRILTKCFNVANETFKNFFVGQFTDAVILGVLCMLGMKILGFPYAAMTGTVIGVTAVIPIVGAYIGAAVGAFMICTVDPMKALWFIVFLIILQQIEGNLIYPKVVGSSVGLPGIWVLAAVTVGGGLCGIAGMLFGVPIAATVYKLYHEGLDEREIRLGISDTESNNSAPKPPKWNFKLHKIRWKRNNRK